MRWNFSTNSYTVAFHKILTTLRYDLVLPGSWLMLSKTCIPFPGLCTHNQSVNVRLRYWYDHFSEIQGRNLNLFSPISFYVCPSLLMNILFVYKSCLCSEKNRASDADLKFILMGTWLLLLTFVLSPVTDTLGLVVGIRLPDCRRPEPRVSEAITILKVKSK